MENAGILGGLVATQHSPDKGMEYALIPLPTLCQDVPEFLEGPSSVLEVTDQILDDYEDVAHKTTAQTGFHTHRGLDGQASSIRPGALTPDTPPPSRPREHGWTPRVGIGR